MKHTTEIYNINNKKARFSQEIWQRIRDENNPMVHQ